MSEREAMLEMMRGYRSRALGFFLGSDVLDVEIRSGLDGAVRGVILTLTA